MGKDDKASGPIVVTPGLLPGGDRREQWMLATKPIGDWKGASVEAQLGVFPAGEAALDCARHLLAIDETFRRSARGRAMRARAGARTRRPRHPDENPTSTALSGPVPRPSCRYRSCRE